MQIYAGNLLLIICFFPSIYPPVLHDQLTHPALRAAKPNELLEHGGRINFGDLAFDALVSGPDRYDIAFFAVDEINEKDHLRFCRVSSRYRESLSTN